jgi:hypothetical protein
MFVHSCLSNNKLTAHRFTDSNNGPCLNFGLIRFLSEALGAFQSNTITFLVTLPAHCRWSTTERLSHVPMYLCQVIFTDGRKEKLKEVMPIFYLPGTTVIIIKSCYTGRKVSASLDNVTVRWKERWKGQGGRARRLTRYRFPPSLPLPIPSLAGHQVCICVNETRRYLETSMLRMKRDISVVRWQVLTAASMKMTLFFVFLLFSWTNFFILSPNQQSFVGSNYHSNLPLHLCLK